MKLGEIISNIDKSRGQDYEYEVADDHDIYIDSYNDSDSRLTCYPIFNWICTDTHVGLNLICFDDEPCAVTFRPYRKSDNDYRWISSEIYDKVMSYILSLQSIEKKHVDIVDLNQEMGDYETRNYSCEILHKSGIYIPTAETVDIVFTYRISTDLDQAVEVRFPNNKKKLINVSDLGLPYNIVKSEPETII